MISIHVQSMMGFKKPHEALLLQSFALGERLLNSKEVWDDISQFSYLVKKRKFFIGREYWATINRFSHTTHTNDKVLETIMSGFDNGDGVDHQIDIVAEAYYSNEGVIARAMVGPGNVNYVKWNEKFLGDGTVPGVVKTFLHEYCHRVGYGHPYNRTSDRNYSVPYAVGHIGENRARAYLAGAPLNLINL